MEIWVNVYQLVSAPAIYYVIHHRSREQALKNKHPRNEDLRYVATKRFCFNEGDLDE